MWPRAYIQSGSLGHLMKGCPSVKVQAVEGAEEPEVLFIGRVDNWVSVLRSRQKVGFQHRGKDGRPCGATARATHKPFQSLGGGLGRRGAGRWSRRLQHPYCRGQK